MKPYKLRGSKRCPTCKERKIIKTGRKESLVAGDACSYELRCLQGHLWWDNTPSAEMMPRSWAKWEPRRIVPWE